ncbi:hypothetical protein CEXT_551231, partial [Caerostris extrusa]
LRRLRIEESQTFSSNHLLLIQVEPNSEMQFQMSYRRFIYVVALLLTCFRISLPIQFGSCLLGAFADLISQGSIPGIPGS